MGRVRVLPAMMAYGIGCLWRSVYSSSNDVGKTNHPRRPTVLNNQLEVKTKKRCLRCSTLYDTCDNSLITCSFHVYTTGEKGLFSLAPPHQGVDGEWSDQSVGGAVVPIMARMRKDALPCRHGLHVSYAADGFTL